ncbi:hypothetical protein LCGC14_0975230 [marine sediment metagenome]|uniref:Uncharacterized protein n=1 Tax=marine sediment metagenome TaxID=412755 RepID=A0A0F9NWN7_9ZZZZ
MSHVPVCAKCSQEMYPKKNQVGVLDYAVFGPYQVWDADLWGCRGCGIEIVVGFAQGPIGRHDGEEGSLAHLCAEYREHSRLIELKPKAPETPVTVLEDMFAHLLLLEVGAYEGSTGMSYVRAGAARRAVARVIRDKR